MPGWLADWWPALALGASLLSPMLMAWIGWSIRNRFVTREDFQHSVKERTDMIGQLSTRVAGLDRDVGLIGERMRHMPSADDVRRLDERIEGVGRKVAAVASSQDGQAQTLNSIGEQLRLLTQHLLGGKR